MLKLMPSLRERKRYLVYEVISKGKLNKNSIIIEINKELNAFIGTLGMAKAGVIMLEQKENKGILRINHDMVDEIKVGLMMIKKIDNENVIVNSIYVSGMLDKAMSEL